MEDKSMDKPSKTDKTRKMMPPELLKVLRAWLLQWNTGRDCWNYCYPYPSSEVRRNMVKDANAQIRAAGRDDEVTERQLVNFLCNNRSTREVEGARWLERFIQDQLGDDVTLEMIAVQHNWPGHAAAKKKAQEASLNTPKSSVQPESGASLNTPKSMDFTSDMDNPLESANHLVRPSSPGSTSHSDRTTIMESIRMDHPYCARPPEANIHPESASTPKASGSGERHIHLESIISPKSASTSAATNSSPESKCPETPSSPPSHRSVVKYPSPDELAVATALTELWPKILEDHGPRPANQPTSPAELPELSSHQGPTSPSELSSPLDLSSHQVPTSPSELSSPLDLSSHQVPTSPSKLSSPLDLSSHQGPTSSPESKCPETPSSPLSHCSVVKYRSPDELATALTELWPKILEDHGPRPANQPTSPAELPELSSPLDLSSHQVPTSPSELSSPLDLSSHQGPTSPSELSSPLDLSSHQVPTSPAEPPRLGNAPKSTGRKRKATSKGEAYWSGLKRRPAWEKE